VAARRARTATSLIAPLVASLVALTLVVAGWGDATPAGAATKKPPRLEVLVANDDGVGAEGIAVLVDALRELPNTKVTVVAPANQQSSTGGKTTEGAVTAANVTTATGYPAVAVDGFPADSVNYGLDNVVKKTPNVVLSGINEGQNLGGITELSGTIGAARAAAARGIPALAVSANANTPDYETAAELAVDWVNERRAALAKKPKSPVLLEALNVPTCAEGALRGIAKTTVSTSTINALADANCASTAPRPTDDITAYVSGYASLSKPSLTPAAPPP
jgi:5'-nucleotidase